MPIVPPPRWRDLSFWAVWLVVALVSLLLPWRTRPTALDGRPACLPAPAVREIEAVWQSPFDLWPALGRRLRAHWQRAWAQVGVWLNAWRAWLNLLAGL